MEAVSGESNTRFALKNSAPGVLFLPMTFSFSSLKFVSFLWKTIVFRREKSIFPINFFTLIFLFVIFIDL